MLPQTVCISQAIWAVASNKDIELTKVCEGRKKRIIYAIGAILSILPFYQIEDKFEARDDFCLLRTCRPVTGLYYRVHWSESFL